jgi:hypothetical protein
MLYTFLFKNLPNSSELSEILDYFYQVNYYK